MKLEEIYEYTALLDEAEQFKPILQKGLKVLKSYAKEFEEILNDFGDYIRKGRLKSVNFYKENGFTTEQAILMSMHDSESIKKLINNMKISK